MRVGISGTYSSGKTLTAMALTHLTGLPRTRARTMREILPIAAPGKTLEKCTAAELVQIIVIRHVDRAVHESRLGASFVSDGTSLQEWTYGSMRVHFGINPNAAAGRGPTDPVPRTAELDFFDGVLHQLGMAMQRHVAESFDAVAHLANELPLAADGHRPVNETFRGMADEQLLETLGDLQVPYVIVGGTLGQRLEQIIAAFGLRAERDVDEAVRLARAEYAALDTRLETLRVVTRAGRPSTGGKDRGMNDVLESMQRFLRTKAAEFGDDAPDGGLAPDVTLGSLDVDSLALVELAVALEREFGVPVAAEDLRHDRTLDEAAAVVAARCGR